MNDALISFVVVGAIFITLVSTVIRHGFDDLPRSCNEFGARKLNQVVGVYTEYLFKWDWPASRRQY